ncbi:hypothetical protein H9P43_006995 [Blastocladiella emersonii ATCC 22665]|nr:hypothetical protein H9P43_006995 [Blastocladiella emersonii ATCC 22665]
MCCHNRSQASPLPRLPPELLTAVFAALVRTTSTPEDALATVLTSMRTCRALFAAGYPFLWQAAATTMWACCESGKWTCADAPSRTLLRALDPEYAALAHAPALGLAHLVGPDHHHSADGHAAAATASAVALHRQRSTRSLPVAAAPAALDRHHQPGPHPYDPPPPPPSSAPANRHFVSPLLSSVSHLQVIRSFTFCFDLQCEALNQHDHRAPDDLSDEDESDTDTDSMTDSDDSDSDDSDSDSDAGPGPAVSHPHPPPPPPPPLPPSADPSHVPSTFYTIPADAISSIGAGSDAGTTRALSDYTKFVLVTTPQHGPVPHLASDALAGDASSVASSSVVSVASSPSSSPLPEPIRERTPELVPRVRRRADRRRAAVVCGAGGGGDPGDLGGGDDHGDESDSNDSPSHWASSGLPHGQPVPPPAPGGALPTSAGPASRAPPHPDPTAAGPSSSSSATPPQLPAPRPGPPTLLSPRYGRAASATSRPEAVPPPPAPGPLSAGAMLYAQPTLPTSANPMGGSAVLAADAATGPSSSVSSSTHPTTTPSSVPSNSAFMFPHPPPGPGSAAVLPPVQTETGEIDVQPLPHSLASVLAHLRQLKKLTLRSASTRFTASSMAHLGVVLTRVLCNRALTHLTIDVASHPSAFLPQVVYLVSASVTHLVVRFREPVACQCAANRAVAAMLARAPRLKALHVAAREIGIGLLAAIQRCNALTDLELHGEVVEYPDEAALLSTGTSTAANETEEPPPQTIRTLRLFLTSGHAALRQYLYPKLARPLSSFEFLVQGRDGDGDEYREVIGATRSLTLLCPQPLSRTSWTSLLSALAASPSLADMHLGGFPGKTVPVVALPRVTTLTVFEVVPEEAVGLVRAGAFPGLNTLVVRGRPRDGPRAAAVLTLLASVPQGTVAPMPILAAPAAAAADSAPLLPHYDHVRHVSVTFSAARTAAEVARLRALIGYVAHPHRVPYVRRACGIDLADLLDAAGHGRGTGAGGAEARGVAVDVKYQERPHWTTAGQLAVVLDVAHAAPTEAATSLVA